jgi:hypothetical protein
VNRSTQPEFSALLLLAPLFTLALAAPAPGSLLPGGEAEWKLTWSGVFDGTDAKLEDRWKSQNSGSPHIPRSRWRENAVVSNGTLMLLNNEEKPGGNDWTSGHYPL